MARPGRGPILQKLHTINRRQVITIMMCMTDVHFNWIATAITEIVPGPSPLSVRSLPSLILWLRSSLPSPLNNIGAPLKIDTLHVSKAFDANVYKKYL